MTWRLKTDFDIVGDWKIYLTVCRFKHILQSNVIHIKSECNLSYNFSFPRLHAWWPNFSCKTLLHFQSYDVINAFLILFLPNSILEWREARCMVLSQKNSITFLVLNLKSLSSPLFKFSFFKVLFSAFYEFALLKRTNNLHLAQGSQFSALFNPKYIDNVSKQTWKLIYLFQLFQLSVQKISRKLIF